MRIKNPAARGYYLSCMAFILIKAFTRHDSGCVLGCNGSWYNALTIQYLIHSIHNICYCGLPQCIGYLYHLSILTFPVHLHFPPILDLYYVLSHLLSQWNLLAYFLDHFSPVLIRFFFIKKILSLCFSLFLTPFLSLYYLCEFWLGHI